VKDVVMKTGQELHDQMTRGQQLTATEQAQLAEWYTQQDEAERSLLGAGASSQTFEGLQAQIKTALSQVALMTQRIQDLMRQNEELRIEVATLKQQLIQRLSVPTV